MKRNTIVRNVRIARAAKNVAANRTCKRTGRDEGQVGEKFPLRTLDAESTIGGAHQSICRTDLDAQPVLSVGHWN